MKNIFTKTKKLISVLILICACAASANAIDWTAYSWIENGSGNSAYTEKYKIATVTGQSVVNIQKPGFAAEAGIYMTFGCSAISVSSHNGGIQGAGFCLYVAQLTAQETEVTVTCTGGATYTFTVYYVNGVSAAIDNTKPEMGSASIFSLSDNQAVIDVSATDQDDSGTATTVTKFMVSTGGAAAVQYTATAEQITLTGLTAETSYSVEIWAKDDAGNISDNNETITFTTSAFQSQCSGNLHSYQVNDAGFHYEIVYDASTSTINYTFSAADPITYFAMWWCTSSTQSPQIVLTPANGIVTYSQTGISEGTIIGLRFLYSTTGGAQYLTAQANAPFTDANLIKYQVGQCAYVPTADNVKPEMVSASFVSVTFNSVTLNVVATDYNDLSEPTTVTKFLVSNSTDVAAATEYTATEGQITVTGLLPETAYTLIVWAKDAAGNISDNFIDVVEFTTESEPEGVLIDDFEGENIGWISIEGAVGSITDNPSTTNNSSAKVLTSSRAANTNWWAGPILDKIPYTAGGFATTGYQYVHVLVYKNNTNPPNLKISDDRATEFVPIHDFVADQWQDCVFDINNALPIDFLFIFIDRVGAGTIYIDDVLLSNSPVPRIDIIRPQMLTLTLNSTQTTNTSIAMNVTASDNITAAGAIKYIVTYAVHTEENGESAPQRAPSASGDEYTAIDGVVTITGLEAETAYDITVKAKDLAGNISENGVSLTVSTTGGTTDLGKISENSIVIYPNPVTTELQITNYELKENEKIEIFDVSGRGVVWAMRALPIRETQTINVSALPQGIYFIKIGTKTAKFIKK
ncbi:MAG: T9SS type A sorting domain-containing protein [Prevotellaceae bacterium]|jgi:chitodextrinase|nr:T9SS type A sorting domain-containing protein [Prevotellaceae bacterium]